MELNADDDMPEEKDVEEGKGEDDECNPKEEDEEEEEEEEEDWGEYSAADWGRAPDRDDSEDEKFSAVDPPDPFISPESIVAVAIVDQKDSTLLGHNELYGMLTKERSVILGVVGEELAKHVWAYYRENAEDNSIKVYALSEENSPVHNMNIVVRLGCAHGFDLVQFFRVGADEPCLPLEVVEFAEHENTLGNAVIAVCSRNFICTWGWLWAAGVVEGISRGGGFCLVARSIVKKVRSGDTSPIGLYFEALPREQKPHSG